MFSTSLAPLLLAGSLAYPSPLRVEGEPTWAGRTIIMKKTGTRLFHTEPDGTETQIAVLTRTDYVVVRDHDGKLWVRQDGVEGWFLKSEAALPDDGVAHFTKLIQENPNDSGQYARRSKAHELKGDIDAALKDYDEAIRISPTSSSWWNNRANLYQKKRDADRALQDYNRSIELNANSAIVYGNRGNAYSNKRDYESALADYDKALQLNPRYTNAIANRGNAYRELRQFDKALADYEAALKIDSRFAYALSNRGALWTARKEYDKALADIGAAIAADPRSALAFLHRGNVRRAKKEYALALDDYDHAIWLDPRFSSAFAERGNTRRELKEWEKAHRDYDAALKIEPKSLTALTGKAWLLATCPDDKQRDGKKAVELALQAITAGRDRNGMSYAALAAAYAEVGNFLEAVANQRRALELKDYAETIGGVGKKRLEMYQMEKPVRDE
jgi:tetratricopeptide (TPR) repeat protein